MVAGLVSQVFTDQLKKRSDHVVMFVAEVLLFAVSAVSVAAVAVGSPPSEVLSDSLEWLGLDTPRWLVHTADWLQDDRRSNLVLICTILSGLLASAGLTYFGYFARGLNNWFAWFLLLPGLEALARDEFLTFWMLAFLAMPFISLAVGVILKLLNVDFERSRFIRPSDTIAQAIISLLLFIILPARVVFFFVGDIKMEYSAIDRKYKLEEIRRQVDNRRERATGSGSEP